MVNPLSLALPRIFPYFLEPVELSPAVPVSQFLQSRVHAHVILSVLALSTPLIALNSSLSLLLIFPFLFISSSFWAWWSHASLALRFIKYTLLCSLAAFLANSFFTPAHLWLWPSWTPWLLGLIYLPMITLTLANC